MSTPQPYTWIPAEDLLPQLPKTDVKGVNYFVQSDHPMPKPLYIQEDHQPFPAPPWANKWSPPPNLPPSDDAVWSGQEWLRWNGQSWERSIPLVATPLEDPPSPLPCPPPVDPKPPLAGLTPRKAPSLNKLGRAPLSLEGPDDEWDAFINPADRVAHYSQANILTSEALNRPGIHRFAIDVDLPVTAIPSTTPGHWHLYIDVDMSWEAYADVLRALAYAGVIETGYARASIKRGYTSLRPPWVTKTADERGDSH